MKVMQGISAARKRTRPAHVVEERQEQRELWEGETPESNAAEEAELCQRLMDSEDPTEQIEILAFMRFGGSHLLGAERLVAFNELRVAEANELRTSCALRPMAGRCLHEAGQK